MITFENRVAIVTGAGGGIGAAIALELGRRGAAVVVNDYGCDVQGREGESQRAEEISDRIMAAGGRAVPDYTAVGNDEAADAIVSSTLRAFGRVDILVNNAGIAGGGGMEVQDEAAFGALLRIHVQGPQSLMRRVWPLMKAQRYGRIVNTLSSGAFGLGYLGGYAAGKGGLMGLTRDAGLGGKPHNVLVNGFLPTADTRMTRQIQDDAWRNWIIEHFQPDKVAQAVTYLASEQMTTSGEMFVVGGGRVARVGFALAKGYFDPAITAEDLQSHFAQAMDMSQSITVFDNPQEQADYFRVLPTIK